MIAKKEAFELARKKGLCVIENDGDGKVECVYAPLKITISDIGTTAVYRLYASTLEMSENGGCRDAINDNGCTVDDEMDHDEIIEAVTEAWLESAEGTTDEDGEEVPYDADANGLSVTVEVEKSIID